MRPVVRPSPAGSPRGFTLVELSVVVALVVTLAAIYLAGAAVVQNRVRADRTRTTIRKIHELIMPQYEGYQRRRLPVATTTSATATAFNRLVAIRTLMVYEMPDTWSNVFASPAAVVSSATSASGTSWLQTGPVLAYAATLAGLGGTAASANGSAECLYLIAARAGLEYDALDRFREGEVGDTDGDGAPEFLDGWGNPIVFIRWAPGFASPLQKPDATNFHDPFDPMRVDASGYALVPLIASAGPDASPGLVLSSSWNTSNLGSIVANSGTIGNADGTGADVDNITNHDLVKK